VSSTHGPGDQPQNSISPVEVISGPQSTEEGRNVLISRAADLHPAFSVTVIEMEDDGANEKQA